MPIRLLVLLAAIAVGCAATPDGPVVVPPTAEGLACKRNCDEHNSGCMDVCGMEAGFAGDPDSVCKPKCEAALRRCYLECPGATASGSD